MKNALYKSALAIATSLSVAAGSFNGNGHIIKNVTIRQEKNEMGAGIRTDANADMIENCIRLFVIENTMQ